MKCTKCGHNHKEDIEKTVKHIALRQNELGHLVASDIESIANELDLSERQVKKYISLIKKYGADELIKKFRHGESVNSLAKSLSRDKAALIQAHKLISKEYDISYSELRDMLKNHKIK